jgi:MtN3 and saliva related transmembrane protein
MEISLIMGLIAGILSTVSFLPQVIQAYRTKRTKDISLYTFLIFSVGIIFWLIYGFLLKEPPIILANSAVLVLALLILVAKIKYG